MEPEGWVQALPPNQGLLDWGLARPVLRPSRAVPPRVELAAERARLAAKHLILPSPSSR